LPWWTRALAPIRDAIVLTYLPLSGCQMELLNLHSPVVKQAIRRLVLNEPEEDHQPQRYMMTEKKIRVLIAKPGLDGHDRGAKIIARALRDAGMEVIYTGLRQTPEMVASAAAQEDVDVIGLSILSGAHNTLCPQLMDLLRKKGMHDVTVLVGGIIPEQDIPGLKQVGIAEVFLPGTPTQEIVSFVRRSATRKA
jgi:methylmalonyl-CoA mutase, C-terminal domain